MARYRLDPARSQFTVHAFATGILSFVAHSPTFAVRDFLGTVRLSDGEITEAKLDLTIPARSLQLLDHVREADRAEIEGRMKNEVLETRLFPEIHYESTAVESVQIAANQYGLAIEGQLSLHGVTQPQRVRGELTVFSDGLRFQGGCALPMSGYRIKPVTALQGAIRLKDALELSCDIVGAPGGTMTQPRILIACVGNIFLGDDAFGVEVAQRLMRSGLPDAVRVVDFGIRGLDLTYALLDGYETVILVDATPRGGPPGTLYVLEPSLDGSDDTAGPGLVETHGMDPVKVLRLAAAMGGSCGRLLLVGCEPTPFHEEDDMSGGLSDPVRAAVDEAVVLIESLAARVLRGEEIRAGGNDVTHPQEVRPC